MAVLCGSWRLYVALVTSAKVLMWVGYKVLPRAIVHTHTHIIARSLFFPLPCSCLPAFNTNPTSI